MTFNFIFYVLFHISFFLFDSETMISSEGIIFFGDSPQLLLSLADSLQKKTNKAIPPPIGINPMKINHPTFPMSCNLLTPKGKEITKI